MRHLGIACGGDDNYATGIAVAMYSALSHLGADVTPTVYILDGGLSADHCKGLERVITKVRPDSSIVWCRVSASDLAGLPIGGYLSQSAYLRLFLGQFVQERTKRIVYVDCDVLVVRDLSGVLDLDFANIRFAAVRDFLYRMIFPNCRSPCRRSSARRGNRPAGFSIRACSLSTALVTPPWTWRRRRSLTERGSAGRRPSAVTRIYSIRSWRTAGSNSPYSYNFYSQLLYIEEFMPKKERHRAFLRERSRLYSEAKVFHFCGQPKPWHHYRRSERSAAWTRAFRRSGWLDLRGTIHWALRWIPRRGYVRIKRACGLLKQRESTASLTNY